jgi:hypothetical protein
VHNKIEHEKHLLRTVVLIKVLVDTRATGCITQQLSLIYNPAGIKEFPSQPASLYADDSSILGHPASHPLTALPLSIDSAAHRWDATDLQGRSELLAFLHRSFLPLSHFGLSPLLEGMR